jgi:hypothetical protein
VGDSGIWRLRTKRIKGIAKLKLDGLCVISKPGGNPEFMA